MGRKRGSQICHWIFTCYEVNKSNEWENMDLDGNIRYMVYQKEVAPKTGREHLQGYVEFHKAKRISQVQDALGVPGLYLDRRKGTRDEARGYCMKKDTRVPGTTPTELGTWRKSKQGKRSDLDAVVKSIEAGATEREIALEFPRIYMRMSRGLKALISKRQERDLNKYFPITKVVLWGEAGSGKTRHVMDKHGAENVYVAQITESGQLWFDGYQGEKVLLLNEFYGQLRTSYMQNLLDNYRIKLNVKGGYAISNWDHVYVTSNCHPRQWYSDWQSVPLEVEKSFIRRLNKIVHLVRPDEAGELRWSQLDQEAVKKC